MPAIGRQISERVEPLARRAARHVGCDLVSLRYVAEHGGWVLRAVIDREGGVDVEACASVSRQLSAMLDVEDAIPHAYTLEVSSPGLEQELLVAGDYERYAGRPVRLETSDPIDGRSLFRGTLRGLRRGNVMLEEESGERRTIPLKVVSEAHLESEI